MTTDPASVTTGPARTRFARVEAAICLWLWGNGPHDEFGPPPPCRAVPAFVHGLRDYCRAEGIGCDELGADRSVVRERWGGEINSLMDMVLAVWSSAPLGGAARGVVAEVVAALKEYCAAKNIDWAEALEKSVEFDEADRTPDHEDVRTRLEAPEPEEDGHVAETAPVAPAAVEPLLRLWRLMMGQSPDEPPLPSARHVASFLGAIRVYQQAVGVDIEFPPDGGIVIASRPSCRMLTEFVTEFGGPAQRLLEAWEEVQRGARGKEEDTRAAIRGLVSALANYCRGRGLDWQEVTTSAVRDYDGHSPFPEWS